MTSEKPENGNAEGCPFHPPKPKPVKNAWFLPASIMAARKNLLSILADKLFNIQMGRMPLLTRSLYFINAPETFKPILKDKEMIFPKSKEFIYALHPLLGDSIFTSNGDLWLKRRKMVEPSFAKLKLHVAFSDMKAACEDMVERLNQSDGKAVSLDAEMAHVTADIIYRTIFSTPLSTPEARKTYQAFNDYIDSIPQWDLAEMFSLPSWVPRRSRKKSIKAGKVIRQQMFTLIEERRANVKGQDYDDILQMLLDARYDDGSPFSDEELIDELALIFMAGHETSAAGLTWAIFLASQYPDSVQRIRDEVTPVLSEGLSYKTFNQLRYSKNLFREALRLYPPIAFLTRENKETRKIRRWTVKKDSMIFISPWIIHRHRHFWDDPDDFNPDRFDDKACSHAVANHFIPFSAGQRVCPGAAFALMEGPMIISYLLAFFDVEVLNIEDAQPRVRISTRPEKELQIRLKSVKA